MWGRHFCRQTGLQAGLTARVSKRTCSVTRRTHRKRSVPRLSRDHRERLREARPSGSAFRRGARTRACCVDIHVDIFDREAVRSGVARALVRAVSTVMSTSSTVRQCVSSDRPSQPQQNRARQQADFPPRRSQPETERSHPEPTFTRRHPEHKRRICFSLVNRSSIDPPADRAPPQWPPISVKRK